MGSLALLQGIFLTQELNRGFLHCRQILYQLSYERPERKVICPQPSQQTTAGQAAGKGYGPLVSQGEGKAGGEESLCCRNPEATR